MFSPTFKNLETIVQGSENIIEITYSGNVKMITRLTTPCGCMQGRIDTVNKKIVLTYTPKNVPIHLVKENKNFYEAAFAIEVEYDSTDGTSSKQTIIVTARVVTN